MTTVKPTTSEDLQQDPRFRGGQTERVGQPPQPQTSKPTPTQAESDAHARGERVDTHEPDGSGPDIHNTPADHRLKQPPRQKAEPPPQPTPTQAEMDEIARGDQHKKAEEEKRKQRAAAADHDRAAYRTRDAKAAGKHDDK